MSGDASEVFALADDFADTARRIVPEVRDVMHEGMKEVKASWQANARETSGAHGKHYPSSITYESRVLASAIVAEVGPDSSKLQGSMGPGFEFGSRNQPPHLDGSRAVDELGPAVERRIDTAVGFLLP